MEGVEGGAQIDSCDVAHMKYCPVHPVHSGPSLVQCNNSRNVLVVAT